MKTTVIRQSRKHLFGMALTSAIIILYYFLGPYDKTRIVYDESPKFTIFLGLLFFGLFFYSIFELIAGKGEITLSEDGIEIRDKGWNHWDYVDSYWTVDENTGENSIDEYLVVQLKDSSEIKFKISNLEKNRLEIIGLIAMYKNKT